MNSPSFEQLVTDVGELIKDVSGAILEPSFGRLTGDQIAQKSPGELVTSADLAAEDALARGLSALFSVPVVGEEGASGDPALKGALVGEWSWLIDPVDGTANFVSGSPDWAVMVALMHYGRPVLSWVWIPMRARLYAAELGAGAICNSRRIRVRRPPEALSSLRGVALTRFLSSAEVARLGAGRADVAELGPGSGCAGVDYASLIEGELDFAVYKRTLPWDHAPGVLLVKECAGVARRWDGSEFDVGDSMGGLIAARNAQSWRAVLDCLIGETQV